MRLISLLVFTSFLLSGCAFFRERYAQKPGISLQEVYFQEPKLMSTTMVFVLLVKNPNKIDLNIEEITYDVQLDDKSFAKSKIDKKIKIPAEGSHKVTIPLPVEYIKLVHGVGEVLMGKDVRYLVTGDAKISGFTIPFKEEGKVNLKDFQK